MTVTIVTQANQLLEKANTILQKADTLMQEAEKATINNEAIRLKLDEEIRTEAVEVRSEAMRLFFSMINNPGDKGESKKAENIIGEAVKVVDNAVKTADKAVKGVKVVKGVKGVKLVNAAKGVKVAKTVKAVKTVKNKKGSSISKKGGYKKSKYNRPRQNKRRTRRV